MTAPEGYVLTDEGLRLYYRVVGDGPEQAIIPLASSLIDDCDPLVEGRTLIFYDQRGRGQSDPVANPEWISFAHEVRDLETVRRHFELERVDLLGWSYLGAVAALYAAAHPRHVRRLVMMCPMAPRSYYSFGGSSPEAEAGLKKLKERTDTAGEQQLEAMRQAGVDKSDPVGYCRLFSRVYGANMMGKPDAYDNKRSDPCRYPNEWPENARTTARTLFSGEWDWRSDVGSATMPALIVHGAEDVLPLAGSQEWASALEDARILIIPDVGHFPHIEAPEVVWPAVTTFLNGAWPVGAVAV
jgi:pimeloyl-ACP methyl ester carboxylesterase